MNRLCSIAIALTVVSLSGGRAAESPFAFVSAIELPRVEGRIDHLAFDGVAGRLYVAALGNSTVEVVDTTALRHLSSVRHGDLARAGYSRHVDQALFAQVA